MTIMLDIARLHTICTYITQTFTSLVKDDLAVQTAQQVAVGVSEHSRHCLRCDHRHRRRHFPHQTVRAPLHQAHSVAPSQARTVDDMLDVGQSLLRVGFQHRETVLYGVEKGGVRGEEHDLMVCSGALQMTVAGGIIHQYRCRLLVQDNRQRPDERLHIIMIYATVKTLEV